jgi:VWFA-related protein
LSAALSAANPTYRIDIDRNKVFPAVRDHEGSRTLIVTVPFQVRRLVDGVIVTDLGPEEFVVEEDGRPVAQLDLRPPKAQNLTPILALDISGSMAVGGKMKEARLAARGFLERLDERADAGLILFDHELRRTVPPVRERQQLAAHREALLREIDQAEASGGTAYLDAAHAAIRMLRDVPGRRAVLLMTDGIDMSSRHTASEVIQEAQSAGVPIYTLGVGEPGKKTPVATVLTLDQSGSMREPSSDHDPTPKIEALHRAASRFVDLMRPSAQTTLLPFSGEVARPQPFTTDKAALKKAIANLRPQSGTKLYDATLTAIETLVAAKVPGKRAVVVLTDGRDSASRQSADYVIERAKQTGIPLHLLGLGRPAEIDEPTMRRMAKETGGSYHYASDQASLTAIFERLSIDLHDEGIDEETLRKLADETGGKYLPARDVSQLHELYAALADELQTTYTATFASRRSSHDGTSRGITISVQRGGVRASETATASYAMRGLVVPDMNARLYLFLLAGVGLALAIPLLGRLRAGTANV